MKTGSMIGEKISDTTVSMFNKNKPTMFGVFNVGDQFQRKGGLGTVEITAFAFDGAQTPVGVHLSYDSRINYNTLASFWGSFGRSAVMNVPIEPVVVEPIVAPGILPTKLDPLVEGLRSCPLTPEFSNVLENIVKELRATQADFSKWKSIEKSDNTYVLIKNAVYKGDTDKSVKFSINGKEQDFPRIHIARAPSDAPSDSILVKLWKARERGLI